MTDNLQNLNENKPLISDKYPEDIYYNSCKEERDIILEYNQVDMTGTGIVNILGTGIDSLTREQAVVRVMNMIRDGGVHHIISMNPYKIMKTRSATDLGVIVNRSDMHLPEGGGLMWAAEKLKKPLKERIPLLSFMMDLIRVAEIKEYTIFMVGSRPEITQLAYANIRKSFPKIRIVGHHSGFFSEAREKDIVAAMRKSEADIVFVGLGYPDEDRWIQKIKGEFKNTVFISVGGNIDIISGTVKKSPDWFTDRGLTWFYRILMRPWRPDKLMRTFLFFIKVWFKGLRTKK